jgi:hypothetical protein
MGGVGGAARVERERWAILLPARHGRPPPPAVGEGLVAVADARARGVFALLKVASHGLGWKVRRVLCVHIKKFAPAYIYQILYWVLKQLVAKLFKILCN